MNTTAALKLLILVAIHSPFIQSERETLYFECSVRDVNKFELFWLRNFYFDGDHLAALRNLFAVLGVETCKAAKFFSKRAGDAVQMDLFDYMHKAKPETENIVYTVVVLLNPMNVRTGVITQGTEM